jgi:hypothetical protein
VSSRLLPNHAQRATPRPFIHAEMGSNLTRKGSRQVASWVARWVQSISLTYELKSRMGSRCSTFAKKLRAKNRREEKKYIGVTIGISCYTCYPDAQINGSQNFRVHRTDGAA